MAPTNFAWDLKEIRCIVMAPMVDVCGAQTTATLMKIATNTTQLHPNSQTVMICTVRPHLWDGGAMRVPVS